MKKIFAFLVKEFKSLLPVTIYFVCANSLLALTQKVLLSEVGITVSNFFRGVIVALIVAKVVAVIDHLPVTRMLRTYPVLPRAVIMAFVYSVAAVCVQIIEGVVHHAIEGASEVGPVQQFVSDTIWMHFWLVQLWLLVLFFNFCVIRELGRDLGQEKFRGLLLRGNV